MKETLLSAVIIAGFALSSSMAHADVVMKSGRIALTGGTIAPNSNVDIPLTALNSSIRYNVQCTITDQNFANNPVVISVQQSANQPGPSSLGDISFNGARISSGFAQDALPGVKTLLEVKSAWASAQGITITNSDLDDSLVVSNCSAVPASH